jgi:hypothetical protein
MRSLSGDQKGADAPSVPASRVDSLASLFIQSADCVSLRVGGEGAEDDSVRQRGLLLVTASSSDQAR